MWRYRVDFQAPFPDPPFIIASNHHSFLDPPLVGAAWGGRLKFVTLADLFGNYPLLDFTLRTFGAIRVRRGTVPLAAVRESLVHLANGGVLCLFPEGTRVQKWGDVVPMRGAAWLAVKAGVPIVGVSVVGTDQVLGVDNKLHRGRIRLTVSPPIYPNGTGRDAIDELTRRWADWVSSVASSGESPTSGESSKGFPSEHFGP